MALLVSRVQVISLIFGSSVLSVDRFRSILAGGIDPVDENGTTPEIVVTAIVDPSLTRLWMMWRG